MLLKKLSIKMLFCKGADCRQTLAMQNYLTGTRHYIFCRALNFLIVFQLTAAGAAILLAAACTELTMVSRLRQSSLAI